MGNLLGFIELLAIVLWLGSALFFTLLAAPALFRALGKEAAGAAVRAIFPNYYRLGLGCALVLAGVQAARGILWTWAGMTTPAFVLFLVLALAPAHGLFGLMPSLARARAAGATDRFRQLHRRSMLLNAAVLTLLLVYVVWMSLRGY
jgi:uncharacterized membrane protein